MPRSYPRMNRLQVSPVIAHALAWAAFGGVVFWPHGYPITTKTPMSGGVVRFEFSHVPGPFMQHLGPKEVMLLLIPVALTGLAVWLVWPSGARSAWGRLALWALGVLCLGYCAVPILILEEVDISFIGAFFLPAALTLIASATIASMSVTIRDAALEQCPPPPRENLVSWREAPSDGPREGAEHLR